MPSASQDSLPTRQAILASGQKLFRQKGYRGTSLRDVMGACGLTIGGFYAHFASKSDLFRVCFQQAGDAGFARVMAGAGPGEFLKPVARYFSEPHVRAKSDGCPLAAMLSELDGLKKEGAPALVEAYLERFAGQLARLGTDPERSLALAALMVGALSLARAVSDQGLKDRILAQALDTAKSFAAKPRKEKR